MTTLQEAARNAIKLLEELRGISYLKYEHTAIENSAKELRAALAQQGEPVAGLNRSYTEQLINALHENSDPVSIDAAEEFQRLLASAPQPAQWESLNLAREVLKLNALWNKSTVQAPEISDQLGICRVLAERVNTDD